MRTFAAAIALTACASVATAQTPEPDYSGSYLCKLTASAGLQLDAEAQTWKGVIFNVSNEALLMKVTATGKTGSTALNPNYSLYGVSFKDFGSSGKPSECVSNFRSDKFSKDVPIIGGHIECRFFGTTYRVDLQSNRIQLQFDGGYMDDWKENQDTPYVAVGVCEKVS